MYELSKKEKLKRYRNVALLTFGVLCAAVLLVIPAADGGIAVCFFRKVTGLRCPGCGNTRALLSILRLDFVKAFEYNPLCFLEFFYIGWVYVFCVKNYVKGKRFSYDPPFKVFDICVLAAVVIWWIVRNIPGFI